MSAGSQPDWYMGWLEGALRLMPAGRSAAFGFEIPNPFFPGVLLAGVTFVLLYAWPFLEARFTGDHAEHHLLDRPRDRPVRTALGVGDARVLRRAVPRRRQRRHRGPLRPVGERRHLRLPRRALRVAGGRRAPHVPAVQGARRATATGVPVEPPGADGSSDATGGYADVEEPARRPASVAASATRRLTRSARGRRLWRTRCPTRPRAEHERGRRGRRQTPNTEPVASTHARSRTRTARRACRELTDGPGALGDGGVGAVVAAIRARLAARDRTAVRRRGRAVRASAAAPSIIDARVLVPVNQ